MLITAQPEWDPPPHPPTSPCRPKPLNMSWEQHQRGYPTAGQGCLKQAAPKRRVFCWHHISELKKPYNSRIFTHVWTNFNVLCKLCTYIYILDGYAIFRIFRGIRWYSLKIQSPCQMMIGVYNHLLRKVFRFHYHSQEVIGSVRISISWISIQYLFVVCVCFTRRSLKHQKLDENLDLGPPPPNSRTHHQDDTPFWVLGCPVGS